MCSSDLSAPRSRVDWSSWALGLAMAGLIGLAFYGECHQGSSQRTDAHRALRCLLGPPPVAAADVATRYQARRTTARTDGGLYPQACRAAVVAAARYHGNASSAPLQSALQALARLLTADDAHLDEAQVQAQLGHVVTLAHFDEAR